MLKQNSVNLHLPLHPPFCRKLQEDLTDEMVGLAQQLKQSSLLMSQSLKNTEKVCNGALLICCSVMEKYILDIFKIALPGRNEQHWCLKGVEEP